MPGESTRLSVSLTPELSDKVNKYIPHGLKQELFIIITEDLMELFERMEPKDLQRTLGAIACHKLGPEIYMPLFKKTGRKK